MTTPRGTPFGSWALQQLPQRRLQEHPDLPIPGLARGLFPLTGPFLAAPGRADRPAARQVYRLADLAPPLRPYHRRARAF